MFSTYFLSFFLPDSHARYEERLWWCGGGPRGVCIHCQTGKRPCPQQDRKKTIVPRYLLRDHGTPEEHPEEHPEELFCLKCGTGLQLMEGGVSWPSGLAYWTQVLVLAAECGFESRTWHLCPWTRHLTIIAPLHPGVKWVPVRAELVD